MTLLPSLMVLCAAALQVVAAAGAVAAAKPVHLVPVVTFVAAAAALVAAVVLRWLGSPSLAVGAGVVGGALAVVAPLLWGRAIGEFTPSHHIVRLVVAAGVVGWFAWTTSG